MSSSLPRRSSRALPVSSRVVLVAVLLMVACGGCAGLAAWRLWRDARIGGQKLAHSLGVVLAEQTDRSLQAIALVQQDIIAKMLGAGVQTEAEFRLAAGSRTTHDYIVDRLGDLPQADVIAIVSPDGELINWSRRWPPPRQNFHDRDYTQYCAGTHHSASFISRNINSSITGQPEFFLTQCIDRSDGTLLDIVPSVPTIGYSMDLYRSLDLQPGISVALRRQEGDTIVRYPNNGPDAPIKNSANSDGRFIFRRALTSYPLVVEVGVSRSLAFAVWRQQIWWIALGSACALICLLLLLGRLLGLIRRLEQQALTLAQTADALRQSEAGSARQSTVLETTLEHMDQGLLMVTPDRRVAVCNRRAIEMLGLPPTLMTSQPDFSDVLRYQLETQEFSTATEEFKDFVHSGAMQTTRQCYERQRPDGMIIEVQSVPLLGGGMVRTYTDITSRKQAEKRLAFAAYHDSLTGLVNRHVLHTSLEQAIQSATKQARGVAILYLDLDRFKLVNDTHGHAVGDQLLKQVAQRMQSCLRDGDVIARLGGDEFAAVLPANADRHSAGTLAHRLRQAVSAPYGIDGVQARVGVSIGVALFPGDGSDAEGLLRSADSALYRAKAAGRDTVCFHDAAAEQDQRSRMLLEQDLRDALHAEQFEVAYQPIFNMDTGQPHSFEALMRWRHPERGLLMPGAFIPIAEATGIINELGRWVLETACREAATWAVPVRLAVNLSSVQFADPGLEQMIRRALDDSGLAPERLDLEVTESALITEPDHMRATMESLQQTGIRLVMDDFGTGHSSLQTLQGFPFQMIKIDRSFTVAIQNDLSADAIVRAVLAMAAEMRVDVVAEGVETQDQADMLRSMGCRFIQGYLLSRPQTPEWTRTYLWQASTGRQEGGGDGSAPDERTLPARNYP